MAFLVSPGVQVVEKDLTNIIPQVATSIGGYAGVFGWGPVLEAVTVSSEADLIDNFGYPQISSNAGSNSRDDWYAAANYLSYSNNLKLVRLLPDGARNSASEPFVAVPGSISAVVTGAPDGTTSLNVMFDGTTSVTVGADDPYSIESVATAFADALVAAGVTDVTLDSDALTGLVDPTVIYSSTGMTLPVSQTVGGVTFTFFQNEEMDPTAEFSSSASIKNLDDFLIEKTTLVNGSAYARYPGKLGDGIGVLLVDAGIDDSDFKNSVVIGSSTRLSDLFDDKPATSVWAQNTFGAIEDEVHVVVYTLDAQITGTAGEILETYAYLSKAKNGKTADGAVNYYADVVNSASQYIYLANEETFATGSILPVGANVIEESIGANLKGITASPFKKFLTNAGVSGVRQYSLLGGSDGASVTDADYMEGYDILRDFEAVDVSLMITGKRSKTVQKYVIEICEERKDCIAFVSPDYDSAVTAPSASKIVDYFNNATDGFNSSSYAFFDSGWKRQYDRYNDEYFWAPLNADIAGLVARTEYTNDAWWSPAGLNRGFIKNSVKLSFNPNQTDRDELYQKRVNPVVTFRGQGTLLYGDKTALTRPSAFDRINVRRLFIVLEKAIATAAKYQLFEFNDDFTRRMFLNAVEPFLANVKTRRGVYDYKVVCDESNNTGEIIDNNRFVADIYIKPTRAINYITLNFVAVRSGVSFNEVVGA